MFSSLSFDRTGKEEMMHRTEKVMRNSMVGVTGQVITTLVNLIIRKQIIQYLGVEVMGLNSTFASILSTLSLAEMGFQQVIVFHLYGALAKNDQKHINALANVYKIVYRCIGCFYVCAAFCCLPFLQLFLSDIEATSQVRLYFVLQAIMGACTYFLAYKRNILYADQQSYIGALIDTAVNTLAGVVAIVLIRMTHSYTVYLLVCLIKAYLSNLIVHGVCTRRYPYLHREPIDWKLLKSMLHDLKDVVIERVAGYIYGSTDNLIISTFISTIQVGFLNNYTMVIQNVKTLVRSISAPLIPALGNQAALTDDRTTQMETLQLMERAYFLIAGAVVVPVYVLADSFISIYIGSKYVIPRVYLALLCMELYIHIGQDACLSFLTAHGLFTKRRNISLGGAIVNIVVSLLLMKPMGIAGILTGTVVSQIYYWIARSVVAYRDCLKLNMCTLLRYYAKQLILLATILVSIAFSQLLTKQVFVMNRVLTFIVHGVICECCFLFIVLICGRRDPAQRKLETVARNTVKRRLHKKRKHD